MYFIFNNLVHDIFYHNQFSLGYLTMVIQCQMEELWMMNCRGYGREESWPIVRYYPATPWRDWGKPQTTWQNSQFLGWDLNTGHSEYEVGVLTAMSWHLVILSWKLQIHDNGKYVALTVSQAVKEWKEVILQRAYLILSYHEFRSAWTAFYSIHYWEGDKM